MKKTILMLAFCLAGLGVQAQVPGLINYQGQILDAGGNALSNGTYKLSVSIFDDAGGNNRVWGPQIFDGQGTTGHGAKVPVLDGFFSILLGPSDTGSRSVTDAFDGGTRFLEITVEANNPMAPRQQIVSAPFAMRAEHVNHIGLTTTIDDGAIQSDDIALEQIDSTHIKNESVGAAELGQWSVGTSELQPDVVSSSHLVSGAVDADAILDGSISLVELAESLKEFLVPTGTIAPYAGDTAPAGWYLCNGGGYWIDHSETAALYAVIGFRFGSGTSEGRSYFRVPDLRGVFLRGRDSGKGTDPDAASRSALSSGGATGDAVGSYQQDSFKIHRHGLIIEDTEAGDDGGSTHYEIRNRRQGNTDYTGGNETRPKNMYVNYIIKR